jgi:hypothetical protein
VVGSGSDDVDVDVDGSVSAGVASDELAASGSAGVESEQPPETSNAASAAQRTAFTAWSLFKMNS